MAVGGAASDEAVEVDPVYSLLKCAADLPRTNRYGHGHACCMKSAALTNDNTSTASPTTSARNNSRSSSPSSDDTVFIEKTIQCELKLEIPGCEYNTYKLSRLCDFHKQATNTGTSN